MNYVVPFCIENGKRCAGLSDDVNKKNKTREKKYGKASK